MNKSLYKLFISIIKFLPNILALLQIIGLILAYFNISSFIITCIGGTSILFLMLLYLISVVFKFSGLYRMSLNYLILIDIISIFDFYIGIPINNACLYSLYFALSGLFLISWIYIWYKNRNKPKIDHLKQLCDNICC